jgi:hypothetical protein
MTALPRVYEGLRNGGLTIIIDALDEARIKATAESFEAFLGDIGEHAGGSAGIAFVLVGRTQIAEVAWLVLADLGIQTRLLSIEPFSRDQANQYIERRVQAHGDSAARLLRAHPEPFRAARDLIFDHLEGSVAGAASDGVVQAFLGYAPVLDAIAILLAGESNLAQTVRDLREGLDAAQPSHTAVLEQVLDHILLREQHAKLLYNVKPSLAPTAAHHGWSDWDSLYTRQEQCARLTALILRVEPGLVVGPKELQRPYEEAVAAFLHEHPFLIDGARPANVVFEAYLFAYILLHGTTRLGAAVAKRLSEPEYRPSRLFADFYLHLRPRGVPVPAEHVGWLYDAMIAAESDRLHVGFSLDGEEARDEAAAEPSTLDGEFSWFAPNGEGLWTRVRTEDFAVEVGPDSTFYLRRYVRRAAVTVPCDVVVGNGGGDCAIGPNVMINCRELRLEAERVVVGAHGQQASGEDEDDGVVLEALRFVGKVGAPPTAHVPLQVNWPGAEAYPWNEFQRTRPREMGTDLRLHAAYRRFRRIVMTLRSHSRGSLARTRKKIEHERVMQGELGWKLLGQLVSDGILDLRDGFYHWVPEAASAQVGVTWHQLRRFEISRQLRTYLERFLG